jgi:hypothetical protein
MFAHPIAVLLLRRHRRYCAMGSPAPAVSATCRLAGVGELFEKGPTMTHAIEKLPKLTRRTLLQVGSGAAGAVSILGLSARSAIAAKVSKAAVAYQDSPKGDQNCASCRLFTAPNACKQVEGDISPNGWCTIWSKAG